MTSLPGKAKQFVLHTILNTINHATHLRYTSTPLITEKLASITLKLRTMRTVAFCSAHAQKKAKCFKTTAGRNSQMYRRRRHRRRHRRCDSAAS